MIEDRGLRGARVPEESLTARTAWHPGRAPPSPPRSLCYCPSASETGAASGHAARGDRQGWRWAQPPLSFEQDIAQAPRDPRPSHWCL